jgi:hypothetical protein
VLLHRGLDFRDEEQTVVGDDQLAYDGPEVPPEVDLVGGVEGTQMADMVVLKIVLHLDVLRHVL